MKMGVVFTVFAAVGCAFGAAAETHWEWTQQGEKVTLAERGAETAWKFTLTKKGVLSLAAVGRTEKLDFGELPEGCPYAIRELAPNFLCADGSSRSAGGNGAAGRLVREVRLPETLVTISDYAFSRNGRLAACNIPARIETIGTGAFMMCTNLVLSGETFPASLTKLAASFEGCSRAFSGEVKIGQGLQDVAITGSLYAFPNCVGITSFVFGERVKGGTFGARFAYGCTNLSRVVSRNPDGIRFNRETRHYWSAPADYVLAGWPTGWPSVRGGLRTRFRVPRGDRRWTALANDRTRIRPWAWVTEQERDAYWKTFYGADWKRAKASEPVPAGYNPMDVRDYEGLSFGQDTWIVPEERPAAVRTVLSMPAHANMPRNGEGDFLRLKDGRILYTCSEYIGTSSGDNAAAHIVARESSDEGETWTVPREIVTREGRMNASSTSLLRLDGKRIAIFYLRKNSERDCMPVMRVSADEGATWGPTRECLSAADCDYYVLNNARARRLKSGRIVLPIVRHHDGSLKSNWLSCAYSDDNGETWRHGKEAEMRDGKGALVTTQEPGVEELADGRLYLYARTDRGRFWQGYSKDGGETWGDFGPAPFYGPLGPATIYRLKGGELLLVWNDHEGHPDWSKGGPWGIGIRTPLTLAISRDEGRTWTNRVNIQHDVANGFYCYFAVLEAKDGLLLAYFNKKFLTDSCIQKVPYSLLGLPL